MFPTGARKFFEFGSWLTLIAILLVTGCGGGGSGASSAVPSGSVLTGVFVDAPVANIRYQTATQSGITDGIGQFSYRAGETVVFSIGSMVLPAASAAAQVTPLDLGSNQGLNDPKVINIARILQALDVDGDPTNGIFIPASAPAIAPVIADFAATSAVESALSGAGVTLPASAVAQAHFAQTMGGPMLGTWIMTTTSFGNSPGSIFFQFFPNGKFVYGEVGSGLEFGGYGWTASSVAGAGRLNLAPNLDLNGANGIVSGVGAAPTLDYTVAASGVTVNGAMDLTFPGGGTMTLSRYPSTSSGYLGTWRTVPNGAVKGLTLVLLDSGNFFFSEFDGSSQLPVSDPNYSPDGLEAGSYTTTLSASGDSTGTITFTLTYDDNGTATLSSGIGSVGTPSTVNFSVAGNLLTLTSGSGNIVFRREY